MTPIQRTLLAIAAFVAIALGSFIWFIAHWDKSQTKTVVALTVPAIQPASNFSVSKKSRGPGQRPGPVLATSRTSA